MRTLLCERLGIDVPVIQGSLGPWSSVRLAAAVSNAGGHGTMGSALRSASAVKADVERTRGLTDRPFAVNLTARPLDPEVWEAILPLRPPVISFALGEPRDLVAQAHEAGSLFVQQVHSVEQAIRVGSREWM